MSAASEADDDEAELTEDSEDEAERISNPVTEPPSADVSLAAVDEDELDEVEHEAWGFVLREPIKVSVWNAKYAPFRSATVDLRLVCRRGLIASVWSCA
jgi:hypothetical protein